jgi:hypothetical protein
MESDLGDGVFVTDVSDWEQDWLLQEVIASVLEKLGVIPGCRFAKKAAMYRSRVQESKTKGRVLPGSAKMKKGIGGTEDGRERGKEERREEGREDGGEGKNWGRGLI